MRDEFERLVLVTARAERYVGIRPVRAFPSSDPQRWITLCDAAGNELLLINDPRDLPDSTRRLLEHALAQREFLPNIQRITSIVPSTEPCRWHVDTDRGPTSFLLDNDDDIQQTGPDRVLIVDADHLRYLIPSVHKLDHRSRRLLERFL